ncbi:hypothetical protein D3C81_2216680 [compost metagenome]
MTAARTAPLTMVGTPKASCIELATVKDCRALKPKPKVTSSSTENSTAIQR